MTTTLDVFISSKMLELKAERDALYVLLPKLNYGDIQLHAWVFEEDAPASNRSIRDVYLKALQNSALYLGVFWKQYGEYTIDEFERATEWGMERHIYVKDVEAEKRDPKLKAFLEKHGEVRGGITAKWFKTSDELCVAVQKSIEIWIAERLRSRPGASSALLARDPDDLSEKPRKLFGRDDVLREVTDLLAKGERVLLQGFGGMGKTALAATIGADLIKAGRGSVLWLKTGSANVDALYEALARPFEAQQAISAGGDAKPQLIRQLLRESGAKLLVLDDCWNGAALFTLLKAVPSDLPVLATARQRYALDHIVDVGQLRHPAALDLLTYHTKQDFAVDTSASQLTQRLGYHAFAIEITGKNMKALKLTPAQMLVQIKDAPHELATPADFGESERRSIKDLLDASLHMLDKEARDVFLAFGAFFAPQVTAEVLGLYLASNPVASPSQSSVLVAQSLDTLLTHGLIERVSDSRRMGMELKNIPAYRVHDLAYSYARAQNTAEQRGRALAACLRYMEHYAEPNAENFAALLPELDNLLSGAEFAFQGGRYDDGAQIARGLYYGEGTGGILERMGFPSEAIRLLENAAQAAEKAGNRYAQGGWLGNLGNAYSDLGQVERAIGYYEQILVIHREIKDRRGEGISLGNLGLVYAALGQVERAIGYYEEALTISREINDRFGEGNDLGNLANAYADLGQVERALAYYEEAVVIQREIKDRRGEGNQLGGLGLVYAALGQMQRAVGYYEEALVIQREIKDRRGEGNQLTDLGSAYLKLGQIERAIVNFEEALVISREIKDKRGEGNALENLGNAYAALGQVEQAIALYEQARAIFVEIKAAHLVAQMDKNIAEARARLGGG